MLKGVKLALDKFHMIDEGDSVVVGVSGGADSVALLLQLAEYSKQLDYTLQVFHLNHMIRDEADHDETFVKELCERLEIPFFCAKEDVRMRADIWHMSVEEAGRRIRYEKMRELGADKIAVGHHEDDLAETVLINMCRGTGLHGMVGIAPVQDDIIRPFIYMTRSEIEDYLTDIGQTYCRDVTNESTDYTRNKLRLDIIPELKSRINERSVRHIAAMAGDMYEIEEYIDEEVKGYYDRCIIKEEDDSIVISLADLTELKPFIKRELLLMVLEKLTPRRKDISRTHVDMITDICSLEGEKTLDLPYDLNVCKSYDELRLTVRREPEEGSLSEQEQVDIKVPMLTRGEGWTGDIDSKTHITMRVMSLSGKSEIPHNTYTKWFDYDKIDWSGLCIRNRRPGDYITINDKGDRKSLQDYMVNEKIERGLRDTLPLLADGSHILWVIGHRISEYYKLGNESKRILEVEITIEQ